MSVRISLLAAVFALCFAAAPAQALTIDVSNDVIRVTTGFTGAELTVFGTQEAPGDVVLVVEGPPRTVTVRKKSRVLGLWTNTDSRKFSNFPSFYEAAASAPLADIAPADLLTANRIGLSNLKIVPTKGGTIDEKTAGFTRALFEMQAQKRLLVPEPVAVTYPGPQLFKARFTMPAIVPPGQYRVSAYLFADGALVQKANTTFVIVPEGLSAELRSFATDSGLLYGLAGMIMALIAGWLATVLLKRE